MYGGSIEVKKKSLIVSGNGHILPSSTVSPCQPTGTEVCIIRDKKKYFETCMHFMFSVRRCTKIQHGGRAGLTHRGYEIYIGRVGNTALDFIIIGDEGEE